MKMPHPVRRVRCLLTPPCSECSNCKHVFFGEIPKCCSNKYLDYTERTTAIRYRSPDVTLVRGTRHCEFEQKKGGAR